jgi:spore maturation protein CgeB
MINDDRKYHNFNGEVIFYFDAKDLLNKINYYMGHNAEREAIGKKAKTRALNDFTYRIRMTKFVNSVRSLRYGYEII